MSKRSAAEIEWRNAVVRAAQARRENVQGIIDDERKAREMGMSYGEYSSMRSGRPIRRRRKQTVEWTPLVVKI